MGEPGPGSPELPADPKACDRRHAQGLLEVPRLHPDSECSLGVAQAVAEVEVTFEGHGVEVQAGQLRAAQEVVLLLPVLVEDIEEDRVAGLIVFEDAFMLPHGVQAFPDNRRPQSRLGLSLDLERAVGVRQALVSPGPRDPVRIAQASGSFNRDLERLPRLRGGEGRVGVRLLVGRPTVPPLPEPRPQAGQRSRISWLGGVNLELQNGAHVPTGILEEHTALEATLELPRLQSDLP
mmetsp:Transcript_181/g.414  ORF Transcript_181/g.414 Transcript_181/m.414 type:complete len:236 (+) Transcript_181:1345-2052(+)